MSVIFSLYESKEHPLSTGQDLMLSKMDNMTARWFVDLTQALASYYQLEAPVLEGLWTPDDYHIKGEAFCRLVERTFNNKTDDLYELPEATNHEGLNTWARWAAGIYQIIRNELYDWSWELKPNSYDKSFPNQPFFPTACSVEWPKRHSGKTIGRGGENK